MLANDELYVGSIMRRIAIYAFCKGLKAKGRSDGSKHTRRQDMGY